MIIDAHAHIFPAIQGRIGSGETTGIGYGRAQVGFAIEQILPPYNEHTLFTPEMLIANLDWAGVDKAVLLQGSFYGECNAYAAAALYRYPERLIGMAYFDPWVGADREQLALLLDSAPFRGIKIEFSVATGLMGLHPEAQLDAPGLEWLWAELEQRRLVLTLDLGAVGSASYRTGAVRGIAQQHPDLMIVIAHLAQPTPAAEADAALWTLWQEQVMLAKMPNVWLDLAALPAYMPAEDYPFPTAGQYIHKAVDLIGPARLMWGTDQPGLLAHLNYPQLLRLAKHHLTFLSPDEQALVLGQTAAQIYGSAPLRNL